MSIISLVLLGRSSSDLRTLWPVCSPKVSPRRRCSRTIIGGWKAFCIK